MPEISIATTSGTTVIRMALTKMMPTGSSARTSQSSAGEPDLDARMPSSKPATNPNNTHTAGRYEARGGGVTATCPARSPAIRPRRAPRCRPSRSRRD